MTPEQKRIAIAEALGELNPRMENGAVVASTGKTEGGGFWGTHGVPDYLTDLNAMHEAEKTLAIDANKDQWRTWDAYREKLDRMVGADDTFHATAAQRADAFIKTLSNRTTP
jgi:hypothetical protein